MAWVICLPGHRMIKSEVAASLRIKLLLLLLLVALIALSAALILRGYIIGDFRQFLEGGAEDRVQMVVNDLEGQYERHRELRREDVSASIVRALMLGMEVKLFDPEDNELMNSRLAVDSLSPLMKKRVMANVGELFSETSGTFTHYPLFYAGKEIGHMEVRQLAPIDEAVFVHKSNRYLLYITMSLGSLAILLGIILSRRLTLPLQRLMLATRAIASGVYSNRVPLSGRDEMAQLAESFNIMANALETQEKLRKKLLANAAHELRTPLMVIRGELEGMMDGVLPMERENLQSLHEEAGRLAAILEGLDDLTRAEASVLSLQRQSFQLAPFLASIEERFSRQANDKGIRFKMECADDVTVCADPDRLSQILINLFSNALKATSAGGEVCLMARMAGDCAVLEMSDTGKGIPEKDLPYIFERFYRLESSGLGLGLAIVSELVNAHGGSICVTCAEGKGATFTVTMPATEAGETLPAANCHRAV